MNPLPAPSTFIALLALALPFGTAAQEPPETGPRSPLDTLSLAEALRAAHDHHPSLAAARERVRGSEAQVSDAQAARFPSLTLEGQAIRYRFPMVVAPLHGFDPAAPPEFDETLIRGRLGASWLLFDGGARGAEVEARRSARGAIAAGAEEIETELIEQTTTAFLDVAVARLVLEANRMRTAALAAEADRVERFLAEGSAAPVERVRAEAALRDAEAEEASAQALLRVREGELARLVGGSPTEVAGLHLPLPSTSGRDASLAGPEDADRVPGLRRARERAKEAEARVQAARAVRWPKVQAVGGFSHFGGMQSTTTREWDAGLHFTWSVFNGGRQAAGRETAEANLRAAEHELRATELRLANELDAARAALEEARARTQALRAGVRAHAEVARIEALSLEEGTGVQRALLDAQASLFEARSALVRAEAAATRARVRLAAAAGKLDFDWVAEHLEVDR